MRFSLASILKRAPRGAFFFLAIAVAVHAHAALTIVISPQIIEKQISSGSSISDVVTFRNDSTDALNVSIQIADFTIDVKGNAVEHPPGTDPSSLSPYLKISPTRIAVAAGQEVFFRYSAKPPKEFTHLRSMILFVCRPAQAGTGKAVTVVVPRLGVPLYVENRAATAAQIVVDDVQVNRLDQHPESLTLAMSIRNSGQRSIRPGGTIEVRSGKRVVRSVAFNAGSQPVLPGNTRLFDVPLENVGGEALTVNVRLVSSLRTLFNRDYAVGTASSPQASSSQR